MIIYSMSMLLALFELLWERYGRRENRQEEGVGHGENEDGIGEREETATTTMIAVVNAIDCQCTHRADTRTTTEGERERGTTAQSRSGSKSLSSGLSNERRKSITAAAFCSLAAGIRQRGRPNGTAQTEGERGLFPPLAHARTSHSTTRHTHMTGRD